MLMVGVPFWERTEIKDLLGYLRLTASLSDDIALERIINVPARKIGKKSLEVLQAWAAAQKLTLSGALFGGLEVRLIHLAHTSFVWVFQFNYVIMYLVRPNRFVYYCGTMSFRMSALCCVEGCTSGQQHRGSRSCGRCEKERMRYNLYPRRAPRA